MSPSSTLSITPKHYQAVCGLALAALFFLQMQQNIDLLTNMLLLTLGASSILFRIRLSPLFVFIAMAGGQLHHQYWQNQMFNPDIRSFRFLDLTDMLLCVAMLTYLVGQYRLHGLWFHVFPYDPRQVPTGKTTGSPTQPPQARSEESMTSTELTWLVYSLPLFALAAECFALLLKRHWDLVGLPPRWRQFLSLTWLLLLGMFLAAHAFRHWRRAQMDRATAQLLLQDVLWNETRGEQRRINRWIVWRKVKGQTGGRGA